MDRMLWVTFMYGILTACSPGSSDSQVIPRLVGSCEGCEAVFESGDRTLDFQDTFPDFQEPGPGLCLKGRVFLSDAITPAQGVVLYAYHTDSSGRYIPGTDPKGWEVRHGKLKAWVRTDEQGRYAFFTKIPGRYPQGSEPAHVHLTVLEPDGKYYWLDDFLFEGDPGLSTQDTARSWRGGDSGVMRLKEENGLMVGERNIILGKNVSEYPE